MPIHNADIAAIFEEIADRPEIQGANPFRIRAYRNGHARWASCRRKPVRCWNRATS